MKLSILIVVVILYSVGGSFATARSINPVCEAVKENEWKAKQVVDERQRAVQLAQSETGLAYSQLIECRPGAIFSAGRAQRCAQAQSHVPLQVKDQLEAEARLHTALTDYHKKIEWVAQQCTSEGPRVSQRELLFRIASLQDEIKALKDLVEQLNVQ